MDIPPQHPALPEIPGVRHREVAANGIRLHLAEAGEPCRPTVVLLHGFPECWYSWRHQLVSLAEAGYHVIAPDQRGYGRSSAPADVAAYSVLHLVGDVLGVLDAVGAERAVVVGHDAGAQVAWHTALLRPERVRGVVGLSAPFRLRDAATAPPDRGLPEVTGADPRACLRGLLGVGAGPLPDWLTGADLDVFAAAFARSGFAGGLNRYRNGVRDWELTASWQGVKIRRPALYLAGTEDPVIAGVDPDALVAGLRVGLTDLQDARLLPGCGHWIQQERPDEVAAALLGFLDSVDLWARLRNGSAPRSVAGAVR